MIAGGGVAGLEAMLALHELAGNLVDVELVSPEHHFWYRPMSVGEPFGLTRAFQLELADMAGAVGATFTPGALAAIEPDRRVAYTSRGAEVAYDVLVLACGTRAVPGIDGALTFRGPSDVERYRTLLSEVEAGEVARLVFAASRGAQWPLPLYELALLTASHLAERMLEGVELTLVTPEPCPLALLGTVGSETVASLLAERFIRVRTNSPPEAFADGRLRTAGGPPIPADRVVALPRLEGQRLAGVPCDRDGFVATRADGRIEGLSDVYAAGDITRFGVRQGGIAAQQADLVAGTIAVRAGARVEPSGFEPVLRALLLTGAEPLYLQAEIGGDDPAWAVSHEPLWSPTAKIAGRHLAPFLTSRLGEGTSARRVRR